jgi:hypothetical protein
MKPSVLHAILRLATADGIQGRTDRLHRLLSLAAGRRVGTPRQRRSQLVVQRMQQSSGPIRLVVGADQEHSPLGQTRGGG